MHEVCKGVLINLKRELSLICTHIIYFEEIWHTPSDIYTVPDTITHTSLLLCKNFMDFTQKNPFKSQSA